MKKIALGLVFSFFLAGTCLAQVAPAFQTIRIGQDLRMVTIYADKDGLHFQYFTEPRAGEGSKFLGEEIFKKGEKVFDSYREND